MKKWFCVIALVVIAGCQKGIEPFTGSDNSGGNGTGTSSIVGTWKFDSLYASTKNVSEYTDMDSDFTTVTLINYNSKHNTGTVTFNADSTCSSSNLSYSVDTTANAYNYENGVLLDTTAQAFSFSIDSSSITRTYELIGSDSIYFPQGFIATSASTTTQAPSSGGRININGNTLTLTATIYRDTTFEYGGFPVHSIDSAKTIITLTKQ